MLARRIKFFRIIVLVMLIALVARIVDIQVIQSAGYRTKANNELTTVVPVPALRGAIYDRNGNLLAVSVPRSTVIADDLQIRHPVNEAVTLAKMLDRPLSSIIPLLSQGHDGYVRVANNIPVAEGNAIGAAYLPGITIVASSVRKVPNGTLGTSVLGFTGGLGTGQAGLELEYNRLLGGVAGSQTLLESPLGIAVPGTNVPRSTPTTPGQSLELTLDTPLQYEAEQALASEIAASHATEGMAIVMDVHDGDILASANLVSNAAAVADDPALKFQVSQASSDLALTQVYEPGSVFKLVTFSAALQAGLINPDTMFSVPNTIEIDGSTFHDAESHPTEQLSASDILAQSSNIGTTKVAQLVGESRLLAQVRNLGFGEPTGLNFPGESAGLLETPATWNETDMVDLPIGQVDAVTAQQVLDAYNAVANGGVFVAPRLVRATIGADASPVSAPASATHEVINAHTNAELVNMLEQVVATGTGTSAQLPGYGVAGKTGTAEVPDPGHDSYISGDYIGSFVGFAPADHPVLSAIVVLEHPTPIFGGTVAAPVFAKIMSYALHHYGIPTTPGVGNAVNNGGDQSQDIT